MINTTDKPQVLAEGTDLDTAVRGALTWAEVALQDQFADTDQRHDVRTTFSRFLGEANRRDAPFDERFLIAAHEFAASDATNIGTPIHMTMLAEYLNKRTVAATGYPVVKRGLKLALVELWRNQVLLLPTVFTPGPQFAFASFKHEVLQWLLSFDPTKAKHSGDARRLYYYGPRLLLASNWTRFEDVSLNDIAKLHLAQRLHAMGQHPYAIAGSSFPWSQLPTALLEQYPDRASFTAEDLARYSAWAAQQAVKRGDFENFLIVKKPARLTRPAALPHARHTPVAREAKPDLAAEIQAASTHAAVLELFKRLSNKRDGSSWKAGVLTYPGREHIDSATLSAKWVDTFRAFLHHREHVQGYRSSGEVISSLNMLADYLFFYLPWWKELYPNAAAKLPSSPREFARYTYVSRHTEESIEVLPLPLLTVIKLRRPKAESAAICIKHLTLYFRFVAAHYGEDESIAGPAFRNPLDDEFDAPRLPGKKGKTNKQIIPQSIYGHLLFWCYAVESFGEQLIRQGLDGAFNGDFRRMRESLRFEAAKCGEVPVFRYRGREIPVASIPNVFTWFKREVARDGETLSVVVPHLSALRLLIASLETGLRCQSVQWLDINTWDSLNAEADGRYTYRLLVNTDKTKVEPWAPPVVFRVRDLMLREAAFQRSFADAESFEAVPYEGHESSPFDHVRPLFRSPNSGRPIRDDTYNDAWLALLVDFEAFYRELTGERHVRLAYIKAHRTPDGQPIIKYATRNANPYCSLSILPVHTPHSCRATFATNRQGQGVLELSDVADLLGHEGVATTSHYTKFSGEQLQERLQRSDVAVLGDYSIFETGSASGYIRADKPDSALVKGFNTDRVGTVAAFRFMPSVALWSLEDTGTEQEGLELLKSGPMSHIRFRETHICPVGEECPEEVVKHIGMPKRCGMCPLAMKCVDHLPAIAAKRNQLRERIRYLHAHGERLKAAGEPATTLDAVWDEMQLDINELLGWQFSEDVLHSMLARADNNPAIHVERPDIVERHLTRVTRRCDRAEFLLHRLGEANAYPSLSSPQVQLAASVLRRRLSAGDDLDALVGADSVDDVQAVASLLRTMMEASGLSTQEMAKSLEQNRYLGSKSLAIPTE